MSGLLHKKLLTFCQSPFTVERLTDWVHYWLCLEIATSKQSQEIKQLRHLDLRLIIAQGSLVIPITTDVFCRPEEAEKFVCSVGTQKFEFIS